MNLSASRFRNTQPLIAALVVVGLLAVPGLGFAQDVGEAGDKVTGFLGKINTLLDLASIAVVTIAVIFAGYQIAFAHKRIADVAPILIGGFLIGAAGQIASMLIGDGATEGTTLIVNHVLSTYA